MICRTLSIAFAAALLMLSPLAAAERPPAFTLNSHILKPPAGMKTIGDSHGDIAVSPAGEIYVSVQGGERPGIQVYDRRGRYLRNVPDAPADLHGFIIAAAPDGRPAIFGVSRLAQEIVVLGLDGRRLLTIPAGAIPDKYKKADKQAINLTGIAVAPNNDIYVTDGYGLDYIHRFDSTGRYLATFGGHEAPWNFDQCHKIAMDTRFAPVRLLCTDRRHDRLVHMDLDGAVIGTVAENLRYPSALAVRGQELAVADLKGRVIILDKQGRIIAALGSNENMDEIRTNKAAPGIWREGLFYAPHGLAYDKQGNLWVTEFNLYGRVTLAKRK
ncbi:MAG: hypothetical protein BGN82_05770 [Alphaproteobacteria bacterium 65-7]|nr:MAG: hypothetical protein BGN82_05770 [Alphaproteobacteria bacterium 65-7]